MSATATPEIRTVSELPDCTVEIYESRDAWLGARGLGASDSPAILGQGYKSQSALQVWGQKIGKLPPLEDNESLEIGRDIQPFILSMFQKRTKLDVRDLGPFTVCRSIQCPWLTASLDGVILDSDEGPAVVEAKNVGAFMDKDWSDDNPPLKFQIQTQHQLAVSGLDLVYTVGLIGGNRLKYYPSKRNQGFIDALLRKLSLFNDLIESETEPSGEWLDASESTSKALIALHPDDNGRTIALTEEAEVWYEQWVEAKRQLTELNAQVKDVDAVKTKWANLLKSEIGDSTYGLLRNGRRLGWLTRERKGYTVAPSKYRELRAVK